MSTISPYMEVINQLYAGKKVTLSHASATERENVRVQLYRIKKSQDQALIDICDEVRKEMKCEKWEITRESETDGGTETVGYAAKYWLEDKKPSTFTILEIEDVEGDNGADGTRS